MIRHRYPQHCALLVVCLILSATVYAANNFTKEELKSLAAPIALYPDVLLAQILPASEYPLQIVDAARYLQKAGGEVDQAPEGVDWHPSVVALLGVPPVLNLLNERLSWTVELGEAVKNQRKELLEVIQEARREAQAAGKLETNDKQVVVVEKEVIKVQPAEPQVIYVPQYYPTYPTTSSTVVYQESNEAAALAGLTIGVLLGAAIADNDYDYVSWRGHRFYYDDDLYDDFRDLQDRRYNYARDLQDERIEAGKDFQENRQDFARERHEDAQEAIGDRQTQRQDKLAGGKADRQTQVNQNQAQRREQAGQSQTQRIEQRGQNQAQRQQTLQSGQVQRKEQFGQYKTQAQQATYSGQRGQLTDSHQAYKRQASSTRYAGTSGSQSATGSNYSRQSVFGGSGFQGSTSTRFSNRGGRSLGGRSSRGRR